MSKSKQRMGAGPDRLNISMKPEVAMTGRKLAKQERRSFSNFLAILIEREAERVGVKKAA